MSILAEMTLEEMEKAVAEVEKEEAINLAYDKAMGELQASEKQSSGLIDCRLPRQRPPPPPHRRRR
jgi:hypothetical protein